MVRDASDRGSRRFLARRQCERLGGLRSGQRRVPLARPDDADVEVVKLEASAEHGTVEIDNNGTPSDLADDKFIYTPDFGYFGTDTLHYTATTIWGTTASAAISVTVNHVNHDPTAYDHFAPADVNTPVAVDVASDAYDPDEGDTLSVSTATATHGTVSYTGGTITFFPATDYTGLATVTFTLSDGHGGTSDAVLNVNVYGAGEWASAVTATTQYSTSDNAAAAAAGAPNTGYYGDQATAWAAASADAGVQHVTATFSGTNQATGVVIRETNGNGFVTAVTLTFADTSTATIWTGVDPTPANHVSDFIITFPTTTLAVTKVDITVDTDHAVGVWEEIDANRLLTGGNPLTTATANVTPNADPIASDLWNLTNAGQTLVFDPVNSAFDPDGDTLTIAKIDGVTTTSLTLTSGATVTLAYGKLSYDPGSYTGADAFDFTLTDGFGGVSTATIHVLANAGLYAASVLAVSSETFGEYTGTSLDALGAPNSAPGGWLPARADGAQTITLGFASAATASSLIIREGGTDGFVTQVEMIKFDDTITTVSVGDTTDPTADPHLVLSFATASYKAVRIDSVKLLASSATVPSAPTGSDMPDIETTENVPVHIVPTASTSGGGPLRFSVSGATHGSVTIEAGTTPFDLTDDIISYLPDPGFHGTDTFTFTATDLFGQAVTKTVTVTVADINNLPYAADLFAFTTQGVIVTIDPVAASSDLDDDTLTITLINGFEPDAITHEVELPSGAIVTLTGGHLTYDPATSSPLTDAFTVTISDGHGGLAIGRVFVHIEEAAIWASSLVTATTEFSGTAGAASKILGAPDAAEDDDNAWQSTGDEEGTDSITVDFGSAVTATGVLLRERSGAVSKIEYNATSGGGGTFVTLWEATDPTSGSDYEDVRLHFTASLVIGRLRLTLDDSINTSNYIDAVGLITGGTYMSRAELSSHSLPNCGCTNFGAFEVRLPNSREFWRSRGAAMGAMRRRWPGGASVGVAGHAR